MRLTWLANAPWTPYGYGQQTALFTPHINKIHPTAVIANFGHEGNPIMWKGVQVFGRSFQPYAQDVMHMHSKTWNADALISMMDVQVFEPENLMGTKWIPWFPVDHIAIPAVIVQQLRYAFATIAMSKHAQEEAQAAGIDAEYIPCGVDANIFKPLDMMECREKMGFPKDKFIVGMVAANKGNPSRKAFQQNIAAFAAIKKKHNDCMMYIHSYDGIRGFEMEDLPAYCNALGLTYGYHLTEGSENKDVIFADQYGLVLGYDPAMMAQLYSSMDVHTLCTMGEGFGIPTIEAQACGTPVIVSDWTASGQLVFGGWKVKRNEGEMIFTNLKSWQIIPHAGAIAERMEAAYQMKGNQDYRKRARAGAQLFDAEKIVDKYWLPILAKIEQKMKDTPILDNLGQNLAVMR